MPLVVRELFCEVGDFIGTRFAPAFTVAQLAGLRPQFSAQIALCLGHMGVGRGLVYRQRFEGVASAGFRQRARLLYRAFQLSA